jgi:site-specific recombinase XerD
MQHLDVLEDCGLVRSKKQGRVRTYALAPQPLKAAEDWLTAQRAHWERDTATAEDLRRFQNHQAQTGVRPPSINSAVAALRFFFTVTLDWPDLARRLTVVANRAGYRPC